MPQEMTTRKTWEEFRDSGFLWWINMILHTFGWAICVELDPEGSRVVDAYPARVKFRGFAEKNNDEGYLRVTKYMKAQAESLMDDCGA